MRAVVLFAFRRAVGGEFVHFSPRGALTVSAIFPASLLQETVMLPRGVGIAPCAQVRPLGWGVTVNVANPGLVGCTPRT